MGLFSPYNPPTSTETLPDHNFRVVTFDNTYNDQLGVDYFSKGGVAFSMDFSKFGTYSIRDNNLNTQPTLNAMSTFTRGQSQGFGVWARLTLIDSATPMLLAGLTWGGPTIFEHLWITVYKSGSKYYSQAEILRNGVTETSTPVEITLNGWHYFSLSYDAVTDLISHVFNITVTTLAPTPHAWGGTDDSALWLRPAEYSYSGSKYIMRCYMYEALFYPNKLLDPVYLVQHYIHDVPWVTTYSRKDILLRPDTDGRVFTEYPIKSTMGIEAPYAEFSWEEAANTHGGTATTSAYRKLTDTGGDVTTKANTITGLSVTTGVFTLPAGIYYLDFWHRFINVGNVVLRLRDLTNTDTLVVGGANGNTNTNFTAILNGYFTVGAGGITAEIEYYCDTTVTTYGLGYALNHTEKEVYGKGILYKIK